MSQALQRKVGWVGSCVRYVAKSAFVAETSAWELLFLRPIEHEQLQPISFVLNDALVFSTSSLPIPMQRITIQKVTVLGHIARFPLGGEYPDGIGICWSKYASVECLIINTEQLF